MQRHCRVLCRLPNGTKYKRARVGVHQGILAASRPLLRPNVQHPPPGTGLQTPIDVANENVNRLHKAVEAADADIAKARISIAELEFTIKCLRKSVVKGRNLTDAEYQTLKAEADACLTTPPMTTDSFDYVRSTTTLEMFTKQEAEAKIKEAEAKIEKAKDEIKEAEAKIKEAEAKIEKAKEEIKDAEAKLIMLTTKLLESPEEIEEFIVGHLRAKGPESCQVPNLTTLDPRSISLTFFDKYIDTANNNKNCVEHLLSHDQRRVPLCANTGTAGSGKTTMLQLVCAHFEEKYGGKAVYITFNGNHAAVQKIDIDLSPTARIALRVLMEISTNSASLSVFVTEMTKRCERGKLDAALSTGNTLSRIVRRVLKLDAATPLLIAIDELRRMGEEPEHIYNCSDDAVSGLRAAALISQWSFVEHAKAKSANVTPTEPTYICASAYAAYDPYKGVSIGSNRAVVYLPLPPLKLHKFENELMKIKNNDELLRCRHLLWLAQGNARGLEDMWDRIRTRPIDVGTYNNAVKPNFSRKATQFLDACSVNRQNPMDFITSVFWPTRFEDSTAFSDNMRATLYAEASGLCSILRGSHSDTIYIHPNALHSVCAQWKGGSQHEQDAVALVQELCELLCQLPTMPMHPDCGKLYERIVLQAMVCRAVTSRNRTMSVGEFLGHPPPTATTFPMSVGSENDKLLSDTMVSLPIKMPNMVAIKAFPLAFNSQARVNVPCSQMPEERNVPWYTDVNTLHKYNCVVDSMLCLSVAGTTKSVTLGFQNKELNDNKDVVATFRSRKCLQPYWHVQPSHSANIDGHLSKSTFIHVLVTPNTPPTFQGQLFKVSAKGGSSAFDCGEALMTHETIREWCPMLAYSGCDARVLQNAHDQTVQGV